MQTSKVRILAAVATVLGALVITTSPAQADTADLFAWGGGGTGQIGNGADLSVNVPTAVNMPSGTTFKKVSGHGGTYCGLTGAGAAYCWGFGNFGVLGNGSGTDWHWANVPVPVAMPSGVTFTSLTSGRLTICGLTPEGAAYCWGHGEYGHIGNGASANVDVPTAVSMPAGVSFKQLIANRQTFCGLTGTGMVYCWGDSYHGQIGNGSNANVNVPTAVTMPEGVTFASIASVFYANCGLTASGVAYCWGGSDYSDTGIVGNGAKGDVSVPTPVVMPSGKTFASLQGTLESGTMCALTAAGEAFCWGQGNYGQIGNDAKEHAFVPTAMTMPEGVAFTSVLPGWNTMCALSKAGSAYCWGLGNRGQIGNGADADALVPTSVIMPAGVTFKKLASNNSTHCGLATYGAAYCWGTNDNGILGSAASANANTPTRVTMPAGKTFSDIAAAGGSFLGVSDTAVTPVRQKAVNRCVVFGSRTSNVLVGVKKLMKSHCAGNSGNLMAVKVTVKTLDGVRKSVNLVCRYKGHRVKPVASSFGTGHVRCEKGALTVDTSGQHLRVSVHWYAPATEALLVYSHSRTYTS